MDSNLTSASSSSTPLDDRSIRHAWDTDRNRRVWAVDAVRGAKFQCPKCKAPVQLKRGAVNVAHFAHFAASTCTQYNQTLTGADWHHEAQCMFADWLSLAADTDTPLTIRLDSICGKCFRTNTCTWALPRAANVTVRKEWTSPTAPRFRADVAVLVDARVVAIFEIQHTHQTETSRPEPWFEVGAEEVCRHILAFKRKIVACTTSTGSPDTLQLTDLRRRTLGTCVAGKEECVSMAQIARNMGYLKTHVKGQSRNTYQELVCWVTHTCLGTARRSLIWCMPTKIVQSWKWTELLRRKRCLRCAHTWPTIQMFRPYCRSCARQVSNVHTLAVCEVKDTPLGSVHEISRRKAICRPLLDVAKYDGCIHAAGWTCTSCDHLYTRRSDTVFYYGYRLVCHKCLYFFITPQMYQVVARDKRQRVSVPGRDVSFWGDHQSVRQRTTKVPSPTAARLVIAQANKTVVSRYFADTITSSEDVPELLLALHHKRKRASGN